MCTSCVLFLMVYECMLWGHRACSKESSLRLRFFRCFVRFAPSDPGVRVVTLA